MKQSISDILTIQRAVLMAWAEEENYGENWGAEFCAKSRAKWLASIAETRVSVTDLTVSEATLLGFPLWDGSGLRLVPFWLYRNLAEGQELTCIDGKKKAVTAEYQNHESPGYIDNDHRGGALAYGFMPADLVAAS